MTGVAEGGKCQRVPFLTEKTGEHPLCRVSKLDSQYTAICICGPATVLMPYFRFRCCERHFV